MLSFIKNVVLLMFSSPSCQITQRYENEGTEEVGERHRGNDEGLGHTNLIRMGHNEVV